MGWVYLYPHQIAPHASCICSYAIIRPYAHPLSDGLQPHHQSRASLFFLWPGQPPPPPLPGNNVASPINVSTTTQIKSGTLGVNALGVFGNTILSGTNGDGNNNGVNSYLNFGATAGQSGYGIRDNNGTLEFRNSSGSWGSLNVTLTNLLQVNGITPNGLGQIASIKFGDRRRRPRRPAGTNYWTSSGGNIYNNTGTNVGVGTTTPAIAWSLTRPETTAW